MGRALWYALIPTALGTGVSRPTPAVIKTMRIKRLILSALLSSNLLAQLPPDVDPSQVVSGITASETYDVMTRDGREHTGVIKSNVDSTGHGVIYSWPDGGGPVTTTLVSPGLSVSFGGE